MGAAASPCLTPALALLLGFAAKQTNPFAGIIVLFAFAMGLSTLLILLGTFSGSMTLLPRAGSWMNDIKKIFGFLLIGVCVYYLQPLVCDVTLAVLYTLVTCSASIYFTFSRTSNRYLQTTTAIVGWTLSALNILTIYTAYQNLN
jgi:thiol:disulfide interchange protein DsbD